MEGGDHYIGVHSTLKAIVQGKQVPDSDLIQCALAQGWNRDADEYACLCIDFMPNLQIQDCCFMRPYVSVCNRLQALLDCAAFVIDSRIVAVVDCTQMPGGEDGPMPRSRASRPTIAWWRERAPPTSACAACKAAMRRPSPRCAWDMPKPTGTWSASPTTRSTSA